MLKNPFWHGTPVTLERFIGREEKLRTIANRISTGQSVALSGSPRSGKTSLLYYLMEEENQVKLYGGDADKLIFSYLDITSQDSQLDRTKFWRAALMPLSEYIQENADTTTTLAQAYHTCLENDFGTFVLERVFTQLRRMNKRLVLMIDGFDFLLQYQELKNSVEFFGGLRSVASQSHGALAVVIAIDLSVTQLTEKVQDFTRSGSPYFNFMDEVILGAFSQTEIDKLLAQADDDFTIENKALIQEMAGGHPYLLQIMASCLLEVDVALRPQQAIKDFYLKVGDVLNEIWNGWQPHTQQAVMSVTLAQLDKLKQAFQRQGINVDSISSQIPHLKSELEFLKKYGFLIEDGKVAGGWRVYPKIFLHFIIDRKLKEEYRDKLPIDVWKDLLTSNF